MLSRRVDDFLNERGRAPYYLKELIIHNFLDSIPTEPHGRQYVIRKGVVTSTYDEGW